ncbi:MAG TPA: hypothetical protein VGF88_16560 [Acidobacteriaceae bacterium]|jgi:hypothetical protein
MRLLRLRDIDQREFSKIAEVAMDCHLAQSLDEQFYLVIGHRVSILLNEQTLAEPEADLFGQPWLRGGLPRAEREGIFDNWLGGLAAAPALTATTPIQAWRSFWNAFGPLTPIGTLPPAPPRPPSIYGHLPFSTTTTPETVIYRWEAFPTSRRIDRTVDPPTIAADTYASPASEALFAVTGFAAVARFALPNLMPACFRWELQPMAGTQLECGASVPLYGQSGGGVEVKFTSLTQNRCSIADPVILPAM